MDEEEETRIENCAISVQQYIGLDGVMSYTIKARGDVPLSTKIGLLELAKLSLVEDSL